MQSVDPHSTEPVELAGAQPASTGILDLYEFDMHNGFLITFNTCLLKIFKSAVSLSYSVSFLQKKIISACI
jgi:hypothetical protein